MISSVRKFLSADTVTAPPVSRSTAEPSRSLTLQIKPPRLESVDILRGIVMVIMALDHVRDFIMNPHFEPTDLTQATAAIFLTRWITHFCAPVFVFLAGTGAFLSVSRGKPVKELSRFLWTRGLTLVLFELTVVRFGWLFNFSTNLLFVQVIWVIGVSMICLAGFVYLSKKASAIIGIVMIVGHNALDGVKPEAFGSLGWLWNILHVSQPIPISPGITFYPLYPLVPWIGVMMVGYVFGTVMLFEASRRRKALIRLGLGLTIAFVVIRAINLYGDLLPWTTQKNALFTFFSFINTTKYPPSLDYLLMTLGPSILSLGLFDKGMGTVGKFFAVYGRVPMFYYLIHIYLIHALTVLAGAAQGYGFAPFFDLWFGFPHDYGYSLAIAYVVWIGVVFALYPVCRWFGELKRRRRDAWLSYL